MEDAMAGFKALSESKVSRQPSFTEGDADEAPVASVFQLMVNRMVLQHFSEVAKLQKQLDLLREEYVERLKHAEPSEKSLIDKSIETNNSDSPERDHSCATAASDTSKERSTSGTSGKKRIKLHRRGSQLSAQKILNLFEDNEMQKVEKETAVEQKFATDFNKLLRGNTRYETSEGSPREDELQETRFERLQGWLQSNSYEFAMAILLCINVFWMAMEAQVSGLETGFSLGLHSVDVNMRSGWDLFFLVGDVFFTTLFALDVVVRICVLRRVFFQLWMNYVDLAVGITSLIEMTFTNVIDVPLNPLLFRLLRIGKLFRAIRMVHMTNVLASLHLLVKCLIASCNMLFWSFCLLTFLQCVAGLVISTLCRGFLNDANQDTEQRKEVYLYFGTFSRTLLTMFEILFANWGPPCRVLIEAVNEWFGLFFLFYRCVLGFAVLNVVNAVFVQQTMKTASTDEELAFKQKEKDVALYVRKVKSLFQTMDASGDGSINLEEFSKLVKSPKLKFWMSQLELEYHDLLSLFEFLDNGDGEITLMEFIEGAARLKGNAKALDIWRLETKLEVLFEPVLRYMSKVDGESVTFSGTVQDVFNKSSFQHIKTTAKVRQGPPGSYSLTNF